MDNDELQLQIVRQERLTRMREEAYRYFEPNGKAESFIKIIGLDLHFINLFIAANGVGKTATLVNILVNICYRAPNPYFQYPLFQQFPYLKKGRVISDPTTVKQTIVQELEKWFPAGKYTTSKEGKNYPYIWNTDTGFEFDLMTYDQDVKEFESSTLGFAVFDEPPPEDIFKATISRMRRGGVIICGFTPLAGSAFFYDNYVTSNDTKVYL